MAVQQRDAALRDEGWVAYLMAVALPLGFRVDKEKTAWQNRSNACGYNPRGTSGSITFSRISA